MARKSTKATTKTEETKAAATEEVKAEPAKTEEKPAKKAETKAPAKKAAAKAPAAKSAKEPVIKCTIEFQGKNTEVRSIVDSIFEAEGGKDAVETLAVYIQPENGVAYYVANGNEEGKSVNF